MMAMKKNIALVVPRLLVDDNGEKIIIAFEVLRLVARLRTGGACCPCPASVSASVAVSV